MLTKVVLGGQQGFTDEPAQGHPADPGADQGRGRGLIRRSRSASLRRRG
ncbi:hypothetical protein [Nocardioides convexus]|nr:hypothetical protein [Nocardioides convexus]